jgi:hypothetical protein
MAAAVLSACTPAGYCNRLEQFGRAELLRIGTDGSGLAPTTAETTLGITAGSIAQQALALALDGYVQFEFTMASDTNTAGVFNLTTKGVDFLQGFTADAAAAANARATIGAGDLTTAINGAAAVLSVSTADVILTLTGITNIDVTWVVRVKVFPKVAHALVPTT